MLLRKKENLGYTLSGTIVRSLDILQNIAARNFIVVAKKKGTSLNIF